MIPTVVAAYLEETPQVFLYVVLIYSCVSFFGVLVLMFVQYILLRLQRSNEFELRTKPTDNIYMITNEFQADTENNNQSDLKQRVGPNKNGIKNTALRTSINSGL